MDTLRVSSKSDPKKVAGALVGLIREQGHADLQAIGAGAVNTTVKAIAIARGYVSPAGIDLISVPSFTEVEVDGEERTAIRFRVETRKI